MTPQRLQLEVRDLRAVLENVLFELKESGIQEDQVQISVIRSPQTGELVYKVIY